MYTSYGNKIAREQAEKEALELEQASMEDVNQEDSETPKESPEGENK